MTKQDIAQVAYEVNRAYCISIGDTSFSPWIEAPEWQQKTNLLGVEFHLNNPGATVSASHESWMKEKIADGWIHGQVKDADKKEHPALLPYDQLPPEQKVKDYLFKQVVESLRVYLSNGDEIKPAPKQESLTTTGLTKPEGVDQSVWDSWIKTMPESQFAPSSGDHSNGAKLR